MDLRRLYLDFMHYIVSLVPHPRNRKQDHKYFPAIPFNQLTIMKESFEIPHLSVCL